MIPEIGKTYIINYVDRDYPCRCPCHRSNGMMRHIMACCWDRSYSGPARCLGPSDALAFVDDHIWRFEIKEQWNRIVYIHETDVLSEVPNVS